MSQRAFAMLSRNWAAIRIGYRTDDPEVRVLFIARYPYKIFYRVRDTVENPAHPPYVATGEPLNVPVRRE